jgi:hypothetical protein
MRGSEWEWLCFYQEMRFIPTEEKLKKKSYKQMTIQGRNSSSWTVGSSSGSSPSTSSNKGCGARVLKMAKKWSFEFWRENFIFSFEISLYQTSNPTIPCLFLAAHCSCEPAWMSPCSQLQNRLSSDLGIRLRFLHFFTEYSFPRSKKDRLAVSPRHGSSETQDIFRIVLTNLSTWLNILGLGTNDLRRYVVSLEIIVSGKGKGVP